MINHEAGRGAGGGTKCAISGLDGAPRAEVDVGLVAYTGEIAEGRLARGQNPVLITFELVLEVLEKTQPARSAA